MRCEEAREMMPAYAREQGATLDFKRHLGECRDCRSEFAGYTAMVDAIRAMETTTAEPPAHLLGSLLAIPNETSSLDRVVSHLSRNRKAYAGAAVVVTGAVGAALLRSRRGLATA